MRKALIILPALLTASPAFAQEAPPGFQLPRELTDPEAQMRLAMKLQQMSNALLNVRVGEMRAAIEGRDFVTPDDLRSVAFSVLDHRIVLRPESEIEGYTGDRIVDSVLQSVEVPR